MSQLGDRLGPPVSPSRPGRRRGASALALSLLVHAGFLILVLGTLGGGGSPGGDGDDGAASAIELSISGRDGAPHSSQGAPDQTTLSDLFSRIRASQSDLPAEQQTPLVKGDLAKLFDVSGPSGASPAKDEGAGGKSHLDLGGEGADPAGSSSETKKAAPHAVGGVAGPGSGTGSLWGLVKPCWDRLPKSGNVAVTLIVTLDVNGRIANPPRIVRPSGSYPDERRLISEARAIAAVTGCMPYTQVDHLNVRKEFELHFGTSG